MYTYYATKTLDKNGKKEPRYNYMTLKQQVEVTKDINAEGLFLLQFYYSKSGFDYEYEDKQASLALEWTEKKVSDYRRRLEKSGYFKKEVTRNSKSSTLNIVLGHERWSKKQ